MMATGTARLTRVPLMNRATASRTGLPINNHHLVAELAQEPGGSHTKKTGTQDNDFHDRGSISSKDCFDRRQSGSVSPMHIR